MHVVIQFQFHYLSVRIVRTIIELAVRRVGPISRDGQAAALICPGVTRAPTHGTRSRGPRESMRELVKLYPFKPSAMEGGDIHN
jgi:hypothetical protein